MRFDEYADPTLSDGTIPICPPLRTWFSTTRLCSRLQLPLKLSWAVTIHKSQGLTLDKVVIDVSKKEFSSGLTFVACSRVRRLSDLLFVPPFPFQRVANLSKSNRLKQRRDEDARLERMGSTMPQGSVSANADVPMPPQPPQQLPLLDGEASIQVLGSDPRPPCTFKYHPVDEMWRHRKCQALGLGYHESNGVTPGGPDICLTTPVSIKHIIGDGNYFYRSIAFAITGSQRQHLAVRQAIIDHMLVVGDALTGNSSIGIEEYITNNSVELPGTWATENEIYAVCQNRLACLFRCARRLVEDDTHGPHTGFSRHFRHVDLYQPRT